MTDSFALVLHSHLPYARGAGRWPHGEEWIHEAILGTYLPLLVLLHDLRAEGVPYRLTIGLTPILIEQLADRDVLARFGEYLEDQIARADADARRFAELGSARTDLARFYSGTYRRLREAHRVRFGGDLVSAFADLARSSHLEILTSAATHGYLPILDERSINAQLAVGRRSTRRLLGIDATGIWLPECAYAPGLERLLEAHGYTHFFTDEALLAGAGITPGEARSTLGESVFGLRAAAAVAEPSTVATDSPVDPLRPYLVRDSNVAVVARHAEVSGQVWSAQLGYPGDPYYREFHRKDDRSGLRYWRVTDVHLGLGEKGEYSPARAAERVDEHAAHFVGRLRDTLASRAAGSEPALLTVTFDSELFGHWWFEGVDWLGLVLRSLADAAPSATTVSEHLRRHPPRDRVALAEGSWGKRNDHSTWVNPDTTWIWEELRRMAAAMEELRRDPSDDPLRRRAARQAARELLLAEASDWPFLFTTAQAADYAVERFRSHALRFHRAWVIAREGTADDEVELRSLERADNPFPDADPSDFAP